MIRLSPAFPSVLRSFVGTLAVIALLAACSPGASSSPSASSGSAPSTAPSDPVGPSAAAHEGAVVFAGPGGGLGDVFRGLLDSFSEDTGIDVTYVEGRVGDNFNQVRAQAGNPQIDVLISNDVVDPVGRAEGLFAPIDPALVPNYADLVDFAKSDDNIGPILFGGLIGLTYRVDVLQEKGIEPPTSWLDMWDAAYAGCVVVEEPGGALSQKWIAVINSLVGSSVSDIEAGIAKIKELKPNLVAIAASGAQVDEFLTQGTGCIAALNQGRALILRDSGVNVDFVLPEEGSAVLVNPIEVIKDGPNPVAAQLLVNYLLSPESQAEIATSGFYSPMNRNTVLEGEAAEIPAGEELLEAHIIDVPPETFDEIDTWIDLWNREIAN